MLEFLGELLWSSASLLHLEHKNLEKTTSEQLQNTLTIKINFVQNISICSVFGALIRSIKCIKN
jgi:hypothetical protein